MKYVRYTRDGVSRYGMLKDGKVYDVVGDLFGEHTFDADGIELGSVLPEAPVAPSKVIGMGINYHDFCSKMGIPEPKFPYIFLKAPTTVIGPKDAVKIPAADIVNFEAEIAVIIKDECKNVPKEEAFEHIFGYTCCNDMTDRTDLLRDNHMGVSKNYDTFLPLGPVIETDLNVDEVGIKLTLNGEIKIDGNAKDMIFKIPEQIEFISKIMTLKPGDVILSGSPAGASPVKAGDVMCIEIEGIGKLENPVANC